jgi:2-polyprenyl-6-methoxyphenol hydroxylase-like FAD-dependent oxidoreductase
MTADLLIAGAGPVGLGVAIEAALKGMSVTVLDPRSAPVDKACGEGLMPSARAHLARLGVHVDGMPFHGIRYLSGDLQAEARFRSGPGLGVRRTDLSAAMSRRADQLGVRRVARRLDAPRLDGEQVRVGEECGRWLVAADGLHSPIRKSLGLQGRSTGQVRFGLRRHYRIAPWSDLVEVYWSATAEAYVTPVADQ